MADVTPAFSALLSQHGYPPIPSERRKRSKNDNFMNEAYTIELSITNLTRFLLSIRQAYLSTARQPLHLRPTASSSLHHDRRYFTDQERDSVDQEAKTMVRQYLQVITNLETVEKQRSETARLSRSHNISFKRWFKDIQRDIDDAPDEEEEQSKWLSMHREGVIWLLKNKLERLSEIQREQQETRVMRSIEKSKSALQNSADMSGISAAQAQAAVAASRAAQDQSKDKARMKRSYLPPEEQDEIEQHLSQEQLQIFAKENQDLIKQYEETLDQVRTAEKSLLEISELQTQLATNLIVQSTYMDQLYADSIQTTENMEAGNKQLKKAAERGSQASTIFKASIGFCAFLIVMDLII